MSPWSSGGVLESAISGCLAVPVARTIAVDAADLPFGDDVDDRIERVVAAEHQLAVASNIEAAALERVLSAHHVEASLDFGGLIGVLVQAQRAAERDVDVAETE
jgi:hypothetical protein